MGRDARTASWGSKGSCVLSSALARAPMSRMRSRLRLAPSTAAEAPALDGVRIVALEQAVASALEEASDG